MDCFGSIAGIVPESADVCVEPQGLPWREVGMIDTVLDAALLADAVLPSLAVEGLFHLLRKDDTVRSQALTCSVTPIEAQNGLPARRLAFIACFDPPLDTDTGL
jgi:hypothetical protein